MEFLREAPRNALKCIVFGACDLIEALSIGVTLMFLWSWFIAPKFDIAHLDIVTAIGIGVLITYITSDPEGVPFDEKEIGANLYSTWTKVCQSVGALLTGYVIEMARLL